MADSFNPYEDWFGIPADAQPPNHYQLLGLATFESSRINIENAVFKRVEFLQPMSMSEHVKDAQRILNEVAIARICLIDSNRKQKYDEQLQTPVDTVKSAKPIPMAIPIDADLALEELKLALVVRKTDSGRQQPKSKVLDSRPTRTKRAWMGIPIGAVACLAAVMIGVYWWFAQSNEQPETEKQIANKNMPESVATPVLKKLKMRENQTSSAKIENKPKEKPAGSDVVGTITLRARDAQRNGIMAYEFDEARGYDNLGKWQSPHAYGQWNFHTKKPGTYTVELVYASPENPGYRIIMGSTTLEGNLENTSAWNS